MNKNTIYFDNAATTQPTPEVCEALGTVMRNQYGNPSSLHGKGLEAERVVHEARGKVARVLGVDPACVFFTSGGTEANNMALFGVCRRRTLATPAPSGHPLRNEGGSRVVTTAMEHPSILQPLMDIERWSWEVKYLSGAKSNRSAPGGWGVSIEELETALDGRVELLSFAHVNNETGAILPLETVKSLRDRLCPGALLHLDCAQSFAKMPLAQAMQGVDIVSVSAHKIHGPKGAGAIVLSERARRRLMPLIYGGGQEGGLRSGTENTPAIAGFGAAAAQAAEAMAAGSKHARNLGRALIAGIEKAGIPYTCISDYANGSPYILALAFPGIPAELMLNHLNSEGVYVSTGAACSSKRAAKTGSHVLTALGLKDDIIKSAIRFSFSRFNTLTEVEEAVERLKRIVINIKQKH